MIQTAFPEYVEAATALLGSKLSGASRDLCERIVDEGFPEDTDEFLFSHTWARKDAIAGGNRMRREIKSLCLAHGVPLP